MVLPHATMPQFNLNIPHTWDDRCRCYDDDDDDNDYMQSHSRKTVSVQRTFKETMFWSVEQNRKQLLAD